MEIQKVFSSYDDYGYEEDRIYSVLMSEEELALFSEIQKEYANVANKALKNAWVNSQGGRSALKNKVGANIGLTSNHGAWTKGRNVNRSINMRGMEKGGASAAKLSEGSGVTMNARKLSVRDHGVQQATSANKQIMNYFK